MTRCFVAFILALLPAVSAAAAGTSLQAATVKVFSGTFDESVVFRGSGLGFRHGGRSYVVTSDHVILHDVDERGRNRHRVLTSSGAELECEFIMADYGRGLGLLRVNAADEAALTAPWPEFAEIKPVEVARAARVAMMGYPAMATGLVRDTSGAVSDPHLSSELFIQVEHLVEIRNGHAEFGMSGGVVAALDADPDGGAGGFVGTISHQIYSEGSVAVSARASQNTILAIPASQVLAWLASYFADPNHPPTRLFQTTEQVLWKEGASFTSGALEFDWLDALGTGRNILEIGRLSHPYTTLYGDSGTALARFEAFSQQNDDCGILILAFRRPGVVDWGSARSPGSLVAQMRMLANTEWEPVAKLWCNGSDKAKDDLADHYETMVSLLQKLSPHGAEVLIEKLRRYTDAILNSSHSERWDGYSILKPSDLEALSSDAFYRSSWETLEKRGQAKELRDALSAWIKTMRLLSI